MAFDLDGARAAGYSEAEIADHLGKQRGFNVGAARKSGYTDADILKHLTNGAAPSAADATPEPAAPATPAAPARPRAEIKDNLDAKALDPTGGFLENVAAGAGQAVTNAGRGLKQIGQKIGNTVGLVNDATLAATQRDIDEAAKRDAALNGTGGGVTGNIAGNILMTLVPGGLVAGAGRAASAAGAVNAGRALAGAGSALMAPTTVGGAAAVGAGMGALGPVTTEQGELGRIKSAAAGAAGGAGGVLAGRLLGAAYRGGRSIVEPFYQAGRDSIKGRALNAAAGRDAPAVAQRLADAAQPFTGPMPGGRAAPATMGELVPGSVPTVGQAAGSPGVAALERTATAIDPNVAKALGDRLAAQNAARVNVLDDLAGSDGARALHDTMRQTTAERLYREAYQAGMDLRRDAASGAFLPAAARRARQGEITKLMQTPAMQEASDRARTIMLNDPNLRGRAMSPDGSVQGLDYARRALNDMIDGAGREEKRTLLALRDRLDTTLQSISPKYVQAKGEYAAMSKPINQMDVVQAIRDRAVRPLDGELLPSAYARALDDATAASATGFRGATLENTMTPDQLGRLRAILADLRRATDAKNAGRGVGSDTVQKLAYTNMLDQAGIPTFIRNLAPSQIAGNLAARGADAVYGRANREITAELAEAMMDTGLAAQLMQRAARQAQPGRLSQAATRALPAASVGTTVGLLPQAQ